MTSKVEYVKKYQAKRDAIMLRPSKEDGARIRQAAADAGMSVQGFMLMLFEEYMTSHPKEYKYGMRLRGYSPGAQPKGVLRREDDTTGKYCDIIVYDRPLSAEEISNYDLDTITTPAKGEKGQGEKE